MFTGLLSPMLAAFPCSALFVLFYDFTQNTLSEAGFGFAIANFCAASLAECTQALIRAPSEVIKQNMQLGLHKSFMSCFNHVFKNLGIAGFYTGYFSLIMREIPFSTIQFSMYEQLKMYQKSQEAKRTGKKISEIELTATQMALTGVVVGAFSAFIVTPMDVLKTKQMTYDASKGKLRVQDALMEVWNDNGIQGLYCGASVRAFYCSVGGFAFFGVLEKSRMILQSIFKPAKKVDEKKKD